MNTLRDLLNYMKWYFPIAAVLCTAGAFAINSGVRPWNAIGSIAIVGSFVGGFPLIGSLLAPAVAGFFGLFLTLICVPVHRLFHLVLPEKCFNIDPGSRLLQVSDLRTFLKWYGIVALAVGIIVGILYAIGAHYHSAGFGVAGMLLAGLTLFPVYSSLGMSIMLAGILSCVEAAWLVGRIIAWAMRKIAPQCSPRSGYCAGGLSVMLLCGSAIAQNSSGEPWLIAVGLAGGFLMLVWPLVIAEKSSLPALILVAAASGAIGVMARKISPAAALFFALACFLLVEIFRKLRSGPASKSTMTLRIAASVVLGAALERGVLFYAARTAPREPETLAPPDPDKTLVER